MIQLTPEEIEANRKFCASLEKIKPPVKKKVRKINRGDYANTMTGKIRALFKRHKYCTTHHLVEKFGDSAIRVLYRLCHDRVIVRLDHGLYMRNDK